ncbi:hydroxyacid dehydrogenase [Lachnospiraceae bacterium 54-53]
MAYKVLIPQDIASQGKEFLLERGYEIRMGTGTTEADLIRDVAGCDGILLRTAPVTRAVLEASGNLRVVARHGAGYNNVDLQAADELGIWVTNAPDSTTNSVAEFTIGALVAAAKKTFLLNKALKEGNFYFKNSHQGTDLFQKTLGIIGLGRIGREVARKAYLAFDMKVTAYAPHAEKETVPDYVTLAGWDQVFSNADFISLHIPLNKENTGLVGAREFDRMKNTAWLINCARGEVVCETDLIEALRQEKIAGVFTDVLGQEPPSVDHPLLTMENAVVTPHMASNTRECMIKMAVSAASQIDLVLSGKEPDWPVNHPAIK